MPLVLFHEASCRFRVLQYVPHLRTRGVEVEVADLHVSWRARRPSEHRAPGGSRQDVDWIVYAEMNP